jgi:hypothetical protein
VNLLLASNFGGSLHPLSPGNKSLLLNWQEQRGAYWIKKYEEAIKAFE